MSPMRALVVDDSRAQRAFLKRMLIGLGFDVIEAEDGQRGLERLKTAGPFELVLVDWNMPVMTGIDFVRRATSEGGITTTKLVMVTSETGTERVVEALQAGAHEYIMKPFSPDVLAQKLELMGITSR